jgi:hypothetical protein
VKLTDLDAAAYVDSLALTEKPTPVGPQLDGALLVRVADDHFVMWVCTAEHRDGLPPHRGPQLLRRVMPADWAVFFAVTNPAEGFEIHHWGPADAG